ncbi:hypothetical protein A2U01_0072638, partial [Trifolium medium]|nr:hypothetical protein [Trifolium medium]
LLVGVAEALMHGIAAGLILVCELQIRM